MALKQASLIFGVSFLLFAAAGYNEYLIMSDDRLEKAGLTMQRKFGSSFKYLTIINLVLSKFSC
jgi:hypothetical protein